MFLFKLMCRYMDICRYIVFTYLNTYSIHTVLCAQSVHIAIDLQTYKNGEIERYARVFDID